MKHRIIWVIAIATLLTSCTKSIDAIVQKGSAKAEQKDDFTKYTIKKGAHSTALNNYKQLEISEMRFVVKFDSSAIYQTISPENQYDINKLYGFSDNNSEHHQFSARFGWRWSANAIRLFAYIYNNGEVISSELTSVPLGEEINCNIQVTATSYLFTVNQLTERFPRTSTTEKARGYQLYPYFGGDEVAPHDVNIWIRPL
jgi:hypothetical protein